RRAKSVKRTTEILPFDMFQLASTSAVRFTDLLPVGLLPSNKLLGYSPDVRFADAQACVAGVGGVAPGEAQYSRAWGRESKKTGACGAGDRDCLPPLSRATQAQFHCVTTPG